MSLIFLKAEKYLEFKNQITTQIDNAAKNKRNCKIHESRLAFISESDNQLYFAIRRPGVTIGSVYIDKTTLKIVDIGISNDDNYYHDIINMRLSEYLLDEIVLQEQPIEIYLNAFGCYSERSMNTIIKDINDAFIGYTGSGKPEEVEHLAYFEYDREVKDRNHKHIILSIRVPGLTIGHTVLCNNQILEITFYVAEKKNVVEFTDDINKIYEKYVGMYVRLVTHFNCVLD